MAIQDQVAVITGGASGMGAATAEKLAGLGAKVALLDMNVSALKETAARIDGLAVECDVTDEASASKAMETVVSKLGAPSICVSCAGIAPAKKIVDRDGNAMPLADFSHVINVNLIGTFNVMRLAASEMAKRELAEGEESRGVIINTASIAAYEGQLGQAAYSASKGGVVGMCLPAARELAKHGIRVMTIAPGIIGTPMLLNMPEKVQESLAEQIPFPKRLGYPSEYADLVVSIIDNPLLNGSVIRLDGAMRMQAR